MQTSEKNCNVNVYTKDCLRKESENLKLIQNIHSNKEVLFVPPYSSYTSINNEKSQIFLTCIFSLSQQGAVRLNLYVKSF